MTDVSVTLRPPCLCPSGSEGFLENQDRRLRIEDRGSRIEDQGSRIKDRRSSEKNKQNHEGPSAQDIEEGLIKINIFK